MFALFARAHLKHLEDEVRFWRSAWRAERQRANLAYDRLLQEKHVAPITGPTIPDEIVPPTDEEARFAEEMESMGRVPGLP